MNIKVSIIVPVYNVEDYLEKCLESLVNQTLDSYEIIIVNDGSPDNSQQIIDSYKQKYPEIIRSFIKSNGGLSDARNYGIAKAVGEYIGFVDSDDYVSFDMFEALYNKAKDEEADIVYSPVNYVNEQSIRKKYFKLDACETSCVREKPEMLYDAQSYAWNKIYRRAFWQERGFTFPLQWFEDSALIYNVMLCANRISVVNEPLYYYKQDRAGAITNSVNMKIFDIFKSTRMIAEFYKDYLKDEYCLYEEYVEYLCIRHIFPRFRAIHKSSDIDVINSFYTELHIFLGQYFSKYKKCKFLRYKDNDIRSNKILKILFKHPIISRIYRHVPKCLKRRLRLVLKSLRTVKKSTKRQITDKHKIEQKNKRQKQYYIQKNGLDLLVEIQNILYDLGIVNFADFGTLLGIVRENRLLEHDLDLDIGVFASENEKHIIRKVLERKGYKLWRSYYFNNLVVEDSFRFRKVKVDINYYKKTNNNLITWLFYTKPGEIYRLKNERSIVEMKYSKITGTKSIECGKYKIIIPNEAEELLAEKYGENWRIPDKSWIYWTSPAATPIEDKGKYVTYKYVRFPYIGELINLPERFPEEYKNYN